jgi:hypothetical protein
MATLKAELRDILDKYGIDPRDKSKLWDCHGVLVLYHRAYEVIAAREGITFDSPVIIEANSADKIVALCVTGRMGERSEWSIGEAAPGNCKNAYVYAIAEKRAKDRVVAKLVGLAEHVYSEDEADEFKDKPRVAVEPSPAPVQQQSAQNARYEGPVPTSVQSAPAEHPKRPAALEAHKRIQDALTKAGEPKTVDEIIQRNSLGLATIKDVNEEAYDRLMALAAARKSEMYASA